MKIEKDALADFVTLANGFVGLLAIMYVIDGEFKYAMALILSGVLIDGVDGILARYFKRNKRHGVYMDSIADMVTFCFAPSILLYGLYYDVEKGSSFQSIENALVVTASMLVVLLGIMRLARFIEKEHKFNNFIGLPTPGAAVVIVMTAEVFTNQFTVLFMTIIIALVMISKIQYPKLKGILGGIAGSVIAMGVLAIWAQSEVSPLISMFVLTLAIVYVVLGPYYASKYSGDENECCR